MVDWRCKNKGCDIKVACLVIRFKTMRRIAHSSVSVDKEGKHPIVDVTKPRPKSDFLETGIDFDKIKKTLKEIVHHDDAEEIIVKSATASLDILGMIDDSKNPN